MNLPPESSVDYVELFVRPHLRARVYTVVVVGVLLVVGSLLLVVLIGCVLVVLCCRLYVVGPVLFGCALLAEHC